MTKFYDRLLKMKKGIAINNLILIILLVVDVNICCEAEGLIMA